ncbi:hypothetical protein DMN91_008603 [Ooceraea biroi]|uniref:Mos1 transposase HTH domain-containing protein n=1 Tax=Ooceraea biroi TaxID=2015173 RepID=A0A3L8DCL7_OOCBI|nr:hypothetical protein DMN91_008603 [Ooceraea biroi]
MPQRETIIPKEYRAVIKLCSKLDVSVSNIRKVLKTIYGYELSQPTVRNWKNLFCAKREDISLALRTSDYTKFDNLDIIRKVHTRNMSISCFAATFSIKDIHELQFVMIESKKDVIHGHIVPRKLTIEQKQARYDHCTDIIDTHRTHPKFLKSLVVGCKTWFVKQSPSPVHHVPGDQEQTRKEKISFVCFYDSTGIIHYECGQNIKRKSKKRKEYNQGFLCCLMNHFTLLSKYANFGLRNKCVFYLSHCIRRICHRATISSSTRLEQECRIKD